MTAAVPSVEEAPFGLTGAGDAVRLYTLRNRNGVVVRITNFGGIVTEISVPDRFGRFANVTLGYPTLEPYLQRSPYFGALIGRYANRIAHGRFRIGDRQFALPVNNGSHHLHGGVRGFDKALWTARAHVRSEAAVLVLRHTSPDGDQGYPGRLEVEARYELTDADALHLSFDAVADRLTPVNLTSHAYFNLAGAGAPTILDHELEICARRFTPADAGLIPTGELREVAGTPFDFTRPQAIGARIGGGDPQLHCAGGYDHNFALDGPAGALRQAARLVHHGSGRTLDLLTDAPGLQFYSGNFLDGADGFAHRSGLCLEPQRFPDAPNQPGFPDPWLRPGERYRARLVYRFGLTP